MFRVGKTYKNGNGQDILVIANDSLMYNGASHCPVIGMIMKNGRGNGLLYYDANGNYVGMTSNDYYNHRLISDEPTLEEAALIKDIFGLVENGSTIRDSEEKVLKIIRQLRKKS